MRALIASLAILAAACTPAPADETAATPAAEPAAPAVAEPAAPPADANAIPAMFHGRWDSTLEGCAAGTDLKMVVTANEISFHESIAKPTSVTVINPTSVGINADVSGEGQEWTSSLELVLNGDKLTTTMQGLSTDRVRCPA